MCVQRDVSFRILARSTIYMFWLTSFPWRGCCPDAANIMAEARGRTGGCGRAIRRRRQWEHWLCRQLVVLGDVAVLGMLVRGLLINGQEGDGGNNGFDAGLPLDLQLCFDPLAVRDDSLIFGLATGGHAVYPWVCRA